MFEDEHLYTPESLPAAFDKINFPSVVVDRFLSDFPSSLLHVDTGLGLPLTEHWKEAVLLSLTVIFAGETATVGAAIDSPCSPLAPFMPVVPVSPLSPFSPVSPLDPVGPMMPCFPLLPGGPMIPLSPLFPLLPWFPLRPRSPLSPLGPGGPGGLAGHREHLLMFD